MDIFARITGIQYAPRLGRALKEYELQELEQALARNGSFLLRLEDGNCFAVSWWRSPKRTRSYPYARVYDTLSFQGKKVTIIPIFKDEGKGGDRDFLQWDTVSLMSLLGVYVIIAYYKSAEVSIRKEVKITKQKFDTHFIQTKLRELIVFQSDALHWNLKEVGESGRIAEKALNFYEEISRRTGIEMHSRDSARKRIAEMIQGKEHFLRWSRQRAKEAQDRESRTLQPKERLSGAKAKLMIENYLGGYYFLTCDEVEIKGNKLYLFECKHSEKGMLPTLGDLKDGLLKMILFTNLKEVRVGEKTFLPCAVLKLTSARGFSPKQLSPSQLHCMRLLQEESRENGFTVQVQGALLSTMIL